MDKRLKKKAEKIITEFFKKAGFEVGLELSELEDREGAKAQIKTEDAQSLIGQQGITLNDLQQILGRILRKQLGDDFYLSLDINQYKESKEKYLKDLAQEIADKIAFEKKDYVLPVMSAFERRVVHAELAKRQDVKTESIGQEPRRRVVIRPA